MIYGLSAPGNFLTMNYQSANRLKMPYWVCCNACFLSPSVDRKLAVTTCGHVICNVCYQQGKQGKCLICNSQCQISLVSDKSRSVVKELFSDINSVATEHLTEIGKVIMFQARNQKRLLTHYQKRNEKLEEAFVKMKQEMQQMAMKLNDQSIYIAKLENSLQHRSAKASSVSQISCSSHNVHGHIQGIQIPLNSPVSLSRHSSATNILENMEVDKSGLFKKPVSGPRLSLFKSAQDGHMGTTPQRSSNHNMPLTHSARSATVSRFQGAPLTPDLSHSQSSAWKSPIFRPPSSFRDSMPSLIFPPP